MTTTTFDPIAASNAREQAIQQVAEHARVDHKQACEAALDAVINRGQPFTTDAVIEVLGDIYAEIREPRLLGAVLHAASMSGRIVATGNWLRSSRVKNHGRIVREWRPI
jgi:hypothetical protein